MKSTDGSHYLGLDHIRAIAALMVFSFHLSHQLHFDSSHLVPAPWLFPLALFDEGHTGVALFMTLSGYLFAKLIDGRALNYKNFFWNRVLRLLPLMVFVILVNLVGRIILQASLKDFGVEILEGIFLPTLPNGGWSITVEFHFYLLLPFLLFFLRGGWLNTIVLLGFAILLRTIIYFELGELRDPAYFTILGHIDQFILGIAAFNASRFMKDRHLLALATFLSFAAFYWLFDWLGGKDQIAPRSILGAIWIILPAIEGLAYSSLIAYYDKTFSLENSGVSRLWGQVGVYSYSIYLLHLFFVNDLGHFLHDHFVFVRNFYVAEILSFLFFIPMCLLASITYRYIEFPFLTFRRKYIVENSAASVRQQMA